MKSQTSTWPSSSACLIVRPSLYLVYRVSPSVFPSFFLRSYRFFYEPTNEPLTRCPMGNASVRDPPRECKHKCDGWLNGSTGTHTHTHTHGAVLPVVNENKWPSDGPWWQHGGLFLWRFFGGIPLTHSLRWNQLLISGRHGHPRHFTGTSFFRFSFSQ